MKNNELRILPNSFGIYFMIIIMTFLTFCGIYCIFYSFFEAKWILFSVSLVFSCIFTYEIIKFYRGCVVIFDENNHFINVGNNPEFFPPINEDCKNIVSYKLKNKWGAWYFEFALQNGKKKNFYLMIFTQKRIIKILQEIQNRGGLVDQVLELDVKNYKKEKNKE